MANTVGYSLEVSIHAPARGATWAVRTTLQGPETVSIHAPARGATPNHGQDRPGHKVSIHAPARGATKRGFTRREHNGVSIHAPARGATSLGKSGFVELKSFNPRAREGRDRHGWLLKKVVW